MAQHLLFVTCPVCGGRAEYSAANRFRPFCSERCKLIDLGRWAAEEYRIPDAPAPGPDEEPARE